MAIPEVALRGVLTPGERLRSCMSAGGLHASEHDFSSSNPHVVIKDQRLCFVSRRGAMKKRVELESSWPLAGLAGRVNSNEDTTLGPFMYFLTLFTQGGERFRPRS